jgi:hypothetical protein
VKKRKKKKSRGANCFYTVVILFGGKIEESRTLCRRRIRKRHVVNAGTWIRQSAKKSGRQPRSFARSRAACLPLSSACFTDSSSALFDSASSCDFDHTDCFRIASSILGCFQNPILCCMFSEFRTYWTCYHHHHYSSSLDSLLKFPSSFVSLNKVLVELLCVCVCVCVCLNPFLL